MAYIVLAITIAAVAIWHRGNQSINRSADLANHDRDWWDRMNNL